MPQAKKKAKSAIPEGNQIAQRLSESFFILTILMAVFLVACLVSYDPADPGPFNPVASDHVNNLGRVLGAWLANVFLFLAGYLAAGMTETGKVGTFGGINIPTVTIFMDGFAWGVDYYNTENGTAVEVLGWDPATQEGSFTNNFESLDDGRAFAQSLVDEGADIILPVAGPVGLGSAALATELGTFSIIGVDVDQTITDPNNAAVYMTSVMKGIANAVYAAADEALNGTFTNDLYVGVLANEGVDIAPFNAWDDRVPQELKDALEVIRAGIIDGSIPVGS